MGSLVNLSGVVARLTSGSCRPATPRRYAASRAGFDKIFMSKCRAAPALSATLNENHVEERTLNRSGRAQKAIEWFQSWAAQQLIEPTPR